MKLISTKFSREFIYFFRWGRLVSFSPLGNASRCTYGVPDSVVWSWEPDGQYSARSVYAAFVGQDGVDADGEFRSCSLVDFL